MHPTICGGATSSNNRTHDLRNFNAPRNLNPQRNFDFQQFSYPQLAQRNYFEYFRQLNHQNSFGSTTKTLSNLRRTSVGLENGENDEFLRKFHHETSVTLENGSTKNIQSLSTDDFLLSARLSPKFSTIFARVDFIGNVDPSSGKVELKILIIEIEKFINYEVLQETPFFVQQFSCWSSICPVSTRNRCGLICRKLECGDVILAITDDQKNSSRSKEKFDVRFKSNKRCKISTD